MSVLELIILCNYPHHESLDNEYEKLSIQSRNEITDEQFDGNTSATQIVSQSSQKSSESEHCLHINYKWYPINCIVSITKDLLNAYASNHNQLNELLHHYHHHRVVMGQNKDFECIISDNECRKFQLGMRSSTLPCWIVTYFVPTSQFEDKLLQKWSSSNIIWDQMRRYCKDCILRQLDRFADYFHLCPSSKRILLDENAGGSSHISEALSFEILHELFNAKLLKTEMEIDYWLANWKKTDYLIQLHGIKYGVSVTRAMSCYENYTFTEEDAMHLLNRKFIGINYSTEGVLERDQWYKQILHIFAMNQATANSLHRVYSRMKVEDPQLVNNTVVLITVTNVEDMDIKWKRKDVISLKDDYYRAWGRCDWIYFNIFP